ncbi:PDDEXK family nuclease [Yoonia sp. MH D7]
MRKIHPRSSISNRGFVIVPVPNRPGQRKRMHFESRLEQKVIYLLLARRDVVDIIEQQRIMLPKGDGETPHTIDLVAHKLDGTRVGVLVKPWKYAQTELLKAQVKALRTYAVPRHADRFVVITDADFTPVQVRNAELIHLSRISPDPQADSVVQEFASDLFGDVQIDRLIAATSLRDRGFRAAVRAIGIGVLQTARPGLIDLHSLVRKGGF